MNVVRKASLSAAGFALAFAGLTTVSTVEAQAAAPCAAQNQAAGAARNEANHKVANYHKAKIKVKKAKKAYKKHHTQANKKRVQKAKQARKAAHLQANRAQARARAAHARAHACNVKASPATSTDIFNQFVTLLDPSMLDATLRDGLRQLSDALAESGLPISQLQPVLDQLTAAIEGGSDPGDLAGQFQDIVDSLTGSGLSPAQVQALVQQLTESLGSSGLSPEALFAAAQPIIDALESAGLPAQQFATALQAALATLANGDLPTTPDGLIDQLIDAIQAALPEPAAPLSDILEQLQLTLDDLLGGLLPGIIG